MRHLYVVCAALFCTIIDGHDVIEGLLFAEEACSAPLGRMVLEANGVCKCLECNHFSSRTVTASVTESLSIETPSVTFTESLTFTETVTREDVVISTTPTLTETNMSDANNVTENWNSSALLPFTFAAMEDNFVCRACSFSRLIMGVAECAPNRTSFRIQLFEEMSDIDSCLAYANGTMVASSYLDIEYGACTKVFTHPDGDDVYILFANSTCQIAAIQDTSVSDLEIAFIVLLCLFGAGLIVVGVLLWWVNGKMKYFVELKGELQKASKEERDIRNNTERAMDKIADQNDEAEKLAGEVEHITGKNRFNNGLCEAAIGVPPPALPLREELNHLAAKMAEVEAEVHFQHQLQRDAMPDPREEML